MKIAKLTFQILFITVSTVLFIPTFAFAHVLKSDGSIGAVVHIDPGDEPIVGQESRFFFEFKDKEGKFTPSACDCTFSVLRNGTTIFTQSLFLSNTDPSLGSASISYTFPEKDVYIVQVAGKPRAAHAFQSFKLDYTVRVDRIAGPQSNQSSLLTNWWIEHIPHMLIIIILLLCIVKASVRKSSKNGEE